MNYNFNYANGGLDNLAALGGAIILVVVIALIICIPFLVLYIVGRWKLYKKAGKNGWEAIVPFYND